MTVTRTRIAILLLTLTAAALSWSGPSSAQTTEPRTIDVLARRFAFEPAEIPVTVGERIRLVVRSGDGVHGIEIKRLKVNKEIPRGGAPVAIEFTAPEEGRYPILCSEYCGDAHDQMKGTLVVLAGN